MLARTWLMRLIVLAGCYGACMSKEAPKAPIDYQHMLNVLMNTDRPDVPAVLLLVKNAKQAGVDLKVNLCDVRIPGTQLMCLGNKKVPLKDMPQLMGVPKPGSKAQALVDQKKVRLLNGKADLREIFKDFLREKYGKDAQETEVLARELKATQNELDGTKVAEMWWALKEGKANKYYRGIIAPIYISKDGYILDGHHRAFAVLSMDFGDGHLGDQKMPVKRVDLDIHELIAAAKEFAHEYGIDE